MWIPSIGMSKIANTEPNLEAEGHLFSANIDCHANKYTSQNTALGYKFIFYFLRINLFVKL